MPLQTELRKQEERGSVGMLQTRQRTGPINEGDWIHPISKQKRQIVNSMWYPPFLTPINVVSSSPVDMTFTRIRLFHSKPNFIPQTNRILVGLPLKRRLFSRSTHLLIQLESIDVLNRLIPSYQGKGKLIHDPHQFALKAQHLSKYIFARQYGLNTPFSTTVKTYSVSLGDYTDRESEIKVLTG